MFLEMVAEIAEKKGDNEKGDAQCGKGSKLGVHEDSTNRNVILRVITKNLVKKCLETLAEIAEEKADYKKSYEQSRKRLKFGVREDSTNPIKVAELCRLNTSRSARKVEGEKLKSTTKKGRNFEEE